jgi:tripartite-type tricarboxylate transporter receptor subunit TctC
MIQRLFRAVVVVAGLFAATHAQAQSDFFQGKTIRNIVGYSPGGAYDA